MYNFGISIDDDLFMEILLNNLRNDITSYQAFIFKFKKGEKNKIISDLDSAKEQGNEPLIDSLESKLSRQLESEIRAKLENRSVFEILNSEKMTPLFLSLSNNNTNHENLSNICMDDGTQFMNPSSREKYILDFYRNLYSGEKHRPSDVSIEDFLGPEISNNPLVVGSKLPDNLRAELERDLSLEELDKSISTAKLTSAGGMDGINNKALKKLWKFIRIPLYN
jgi:hypothetical protein